MNPKIIGLIVITTVALNSFLGFAEPGGEPATPTILSESELIEIRGMIRGCYCVEEGGGYPCLGQIEIQILTLCVTHPVDIQGPPFWYTGRDCDFDGGSVYTITDGPLVNDTLRFNADTNADLVPVAYCIKRASGFCRTVFDDGDPPDGLHYKLSCAGAEFGMEEAAGTHLVGIGSFCP